MSVYHQILHLYDRRLQDEKEVAKTVVEFFTEDLDPSMPLNDVMGYRDNDGSQSEADSDAGSDQDDDDSEGGSPSSFDPTKPGCVIYDFNRVSILEHNEAEMKFLGSVTNSFFLPKQM